MYHIIIVLAAAFAFLNGAHPLQPQDAIPPFGASHGTQPAPTPASRTNLRPMDAIPPFG
jgi:hypothetical protein